MKRIGVPALIAATLALAILGGWRCPVLLAFGVPCPTCGVTRATRLVLHGGFAGAGAGRVGASGERARAGAWAKRARGTRGRERAVKRARRGRVSTCISLTSVYCRPINMTKGSEGRRVGEQLEIEAVVRPKTHG